jgi:hypothetical protein
MWVLIDLNLHLQNWTLEVNSWSEIKQNLHNQIIPQASCPWLIVHLQNLNLTPQTQTTHQPHSHIVFIVHALESTCIWLFWRFISLRLDYILFLLPKPTILNLSLWHSLDFLVQIGCFSQSSGSKSVKWALAIILPSFKDL